MNQQSQQQLETFIQGKLRPDAIPGFLNFWQADRPDPTKLEVEAYMQGWIIAWGFADGSADDVNRFPQDPDYALGYRLGREYVVISQPL